LNHETTCFILFSVSFILDVIFSTVYTVQTVQYLASWILHIDRVEAGDDVIGDLPQSLLGRRTVSPDVKNLKHVVTCTLHCNACHSSTGFSGKIEVESLLGPSSLPRSGASGVESLRQSLAASLEAARIVNLPLLFRLVVLINLHWGPLAENQGPKSHDFCQMKLAKNLCSLILNISGI